MTATEVSRIYRSHRTFDGEDATAFGQAYFTTPPFATPGIHFLPLTPRTKAHALAQPANTLTFARPRYTTAHAGLPVARHHICTRVTLAGRGTPGAAPAPYQLPPPAFYTTSVLSHSLMRLKTHRTRTVNTYRHSATRDAWPHRATLISPTLYALRAPAPTHYCPACPPTAPLPTTLPACPVSVDETWHISLKTARKTPTVYGLWCNSVVRCAGGSC